MTNLPEPAIPSSASPEDVLKWMAFYLSGFANVVSQMVDVLATEAQVEAHPKAIVTLHRRAQDMQQYSHMVKDYLDERAQQISAADKLDRDRDGQ